MRQSWEIQENDDLTNRHSVETKLIDCQSRHENHDADDHNEMRGLVDAFVVTLKICSTALAQSSKNHLEILFVFGIIIIQESNRNICGPTLSLALQLLLVD